MFRVSTQMLEMGQGWVKCGRCKKVFDSDQNQVEPSAFLKTKESSDIGDQTEKTRFSSLSVQEKSDSTDLKAKPEGQASETGSGDQTEKIESSRPAAEKKSANLGVESKQERQLSFIESKEDKKLETSEPQATLVGKKADEIKTDKRIEKQTDKMASSAEVVVKISQQKITPAEQEEKTTLKLSTREINRPVSEETPLTVKPSTTSVRPTRERTLTEQQKMNAKAEKKRKAEKSQWTKMILAQAQSWKSEKNRFQSRRSYTAILVMIGLLALLIWQVAIVNYSKLANYNFLAGPLKLTCAMVSCNKEKPASEHQFEILHASLRPHQTSPGVITISANLINYSNSDKLLPSIRLDLTDANDVVVASRTINLVDNPQYIDPAISQLAPGQDVKLKLDIDRPVRSAVGFELSVIN